MSMTLIWPWGLLSLLVVAAAAVVAMRRPLQRVMPVSSLRLWREAAAALGPAASRRARRVTAAWLLLLAGAVAAALALSRPVWYTSRPARRIALAVYPGAELGQTGQKALVRSAKALLARLAPADGVRLILPTVLGGATGRLTPDEAADRIGQLDLLPAPAARLTLPAGAEDVGHLYRFAPATLAMTDGP
ncbi:hypothetical protein LCGC14_2759220, partial [marine sediment metagenome]